MGTEFWFVELWFIELWFIKLWFVDPELVEFAAAKSQRTETIVFPHSKSGSAGSDKVNADTLPDDGGSSSSRNTQIDLSPPSDDDKVHPKSSDVLMDEENAPGSADVNEMHLWAPHKAAKDIEVGDYYFNRKNYIAAESRYREALYYKNNDALATYRLAVCLEKLDRPDEAREQYENYLKILPHDRSRRGREENRTLTKPAAAAAKVAK